MGKAHHIVWDWNGTIFDDSAMVIDISNEVFAAAGFDPVTPDQYRAAYRRPIRDFYADLSGAPLSDEQWQMVDRLFHDLYASRVRTVGLAHGVVEVFAHIKANGWTQSLLSMYPHHILLGHIQELEIGDVFARIDGAKAGATGHSKAGYLKEHLAALNVDPAITIVIGDALDDVDAANFVGADAIFYASGLHSDETAAAQSAPVARNMTEVLALLKAREGVTAPR